jgi:hypothetical protein
VRARHLFCLVNNCEPPYSIGGVAKHLGADKFVYPPQIVPTIGEALSATGVSWKWYIENPPQRITFDCLPEQSPCEMGLMKLALDIRSAVPDLLK